MKIIGITGGIGAGKSCVLREIEVLDGTFVIEADKLAHTLLSPGHDCYTEVVSCFGKEILSEDQSIDRAVLRKLVMNSSEKLRQLNALVHPAVKKYIVNDIEKKRDLGYKYYVIEAALLIQDGYRNICDEIWYIYADKDLRIDRLLKSRGYSRQTAEEFIKNQPEDEYFIENSDRVIDNSGTPEELRKVILTLVN
ncbi:MAG: dephospho-CoA kinase [Eubacterium sp.]|nr:dephospho-CoA kinase [Eubacterium sp.]